ncbi:thylakoid lumenal protein [Salix suchowensis]|nr:thylakoid lumenal protein [Salix suchowensis]
MEKVKRDRKKRLEKQGVISSANQEKGYLQDLVYKLSKVGQAIDKNDLSTAGSVLGGSTDTEWVQKANIAFTKLSSSPDEKTQVDTFNSSLASLISSVTGNDIESSKTAFVSSADAFEKWTALTGLVGQLKGL